MKEKQHSEVEGLVAVVLGVAFVGWLIAAPLSGWAGSVKDALGRFLALLVAISHVAVWLIPLAVIAGLFVALLVRVWFPRRASEVITKLLRLEEERPGIRRVWRRGSSWRLAWKMPVGVTSEKVLEQKIAIEQALDCSMSACWYSRGLVRAEFGVARLPQRLTFGDFGRRVERRLGGLALPLILGASGLVRSRWTWPSSRTCWLAAPRGPGSRCCCASSSSAWWRGSIRRSCGWCSST